MTLNKAISSGTYSPIELMDAVWITCRGNASIGMGLDELNNLGKIGKEFKGELDGLDALCYHLNSETCEAAIETLKRVLDRFGETWAERI